MSNQPETVEKIRVVAYDARGRIAEMVQETWSPDGELVSTVRKIYDHGSAERPVALAPVDVKSEDGLMKLVRAAGCARARTSGRFWNSSKSSLATLTSIATTSCS